ncbi:MAG: hypothetical protein K8S99_11680 [Planctomycetes bacterium]|nr:hypothetical protein [Planctomycetota bacterium]
MRTPEAQIKEAILHPQEEVRLMALAYYCGASTADPSLMPLVIRAVETHSRDKAFRILRDADHLLQTPAAIDWLARELAGERQHQDLNGENYRFAAALIVQNAYPELLIRRHAELAALLPEQLRPAFDERLKMHFWDWPAAWSALEALGSRTMEAHTVTREDSRHGDRIIEALARHPQAGADQVLGLLRRQYRSVDRPLMEWLEPWIVELAGRLRMEKAIPLLIKRMGEDNESVIDEVGPALARIGTDAVIQGVNRAWRDVDTGGRFSLCEPLEHIHGDLSVERCLTFLEEEDDLDVALSLGHAALSHLDPVAIEPVRELVQTDEDDADPEQRDLRHKLVAACVIMGRTFPEFDRWYRESVESNWGWMDHDPYPLAKSFGTEQELDDALDERQAGHHKGPR